MKEQLSALIDGEFEIENAHHLITAAKSDGEIASSWASYHLISDVIRGNTVMSSKLRQRIILSLGDHSNSQALEVDNKTSNVTHIHQNDNVPKINVSSKKWGRNITPAWSVAASVAAVMFVGVSVLDQNDADGHKNNLLAPIQIAQNIPMEYLQAHQDAAPNGLAYYIQPASFTNQD